MKLIAFLRALDGYLAESRIFVFRGAYLRTHPCVCVYVGTG